MKNIRLKKKSLSSLPIRHIQESFCSYIRSDKNGFAPLEFHCGDGVPRFKRVDVGARLQGTLIKQKYHGDRRNGNVAKLNIL